MSVVSSTLLRANPTGTVSIGGVKNYQTVHLVTVDSESDGVVAVAAAIGTPGTTKYNQGGESDSAAVLKSITPKRREGNRMLWDVSSDWGPISDKDEQKTDRKEPTQGTIPKKEVLGEATDNPLEFADTVERDVMWRQSEMWVARFLGMGERDDNFNIDSDLYKIGDVCAIGNSAGEIRDPPEMEEYPVALWRFVIHRDTIDADKCELYTNAINEDVWTWKSDVWGVNITAQPGTAWCQSFVGSLSIINGVRVARLTVTIAIDPKGWYVKLPDMGYRRRYNSMYDEPPFKNSGGGPMGEPPEIGTKWVEMKDVYGQPLRQPAGLNGHGEPLPVGAPPIVFFWQSTKLKEVSFKTILDR